MPPKKATANGSKRKVNAIQDSHPSKRAKSETSAFKQSTQEEEFGIVDREFYPPEMTNARCLQYNNNELIRPIEALDSARQETAPERKAVEVKDAVVHWFKCDLRIEDNRALNLASEKAKEQNVPLICLYLVSPQDFKAHMTSAVRVDFILRTLETLKKDLGKLDIPLYVETVEKRKAIPDRIFELCEKWGASHLFANIEYEVDELRREAKIVTKGIEKGIAVEVVSDTCVVAPGELSSKTGNQYAVYTPWFRAWIAYLHANPDQLDLFSPPGKNPADTRSTFKDLFESKIPNAPENKKLTAEEMKRFRSMWPPGEQEAHERLDKFLKQKVNKYKEERNIPAANSTAVLSVHFASGTLSARTAVVRARDVNSTKKLDGGSAGIANWISEVAWRDFYKHVLAHWPYVCMNKPFKPEYTNISWEYSRSNFEAWCNGRTGYPFVDAAMRQLNHTGYMHNRARMTVASFLAKDLLLDWRLGERYFMERLIDGDFASNNGGWGFSASTGVDPQPYFRIFNPLLQSERYDPDGHYIRKWLPELAAAVQSNKALHDPYGRGAAAQAEKAGYPRPVVEHK
ncbi:hypothetical protein MMC29_007228, partial [Sticta canariensis]|nr:hypothetical protein [Sticta canariensis]